MRMAQIGQIEQFNRDTDDLSMYIERVQFYFDANGISDAKKKAALLSLVGPDTFKILSSLLVPERPTDNLYEELKKIITAHFCPNRSQVYSHSVFYQCIQKPGMSIAAYLSELQSIAKDCGFSVPCWETVWSVVFMTLLFGSTYLRSKMTSHLRMLFFRQLQWSQLS